MINYDAQPVSKTPLNEPTLENFDTTNLVGVLDVLVQMDLALNGLKDYSKQAVDDSAEPGESA